MSTFTIDSRDIAFTQWEHLRVQRLFANPKYSGFERADAQAIIDEGQRFAKEAVFPTRARGDKEGCRFEGGNVKVPESFKALYHQFCEGGWMGLTAPEDLGGSNVPLAVGIGAGEALTAANPAFSIYTGLTRGVARLLERYGSKWQRETIAQRLFTGEWTGTMCLTEPQAGTAVGDARTTATRDGETYLVRGTKIFISGGENDIGKNIVHLVLARVQGAPAGIKGLSLFVVPKKWINGDGSLGEPNDVVCAGIEEKMGLHGSATCVMQFGDKKGSRGFIVGEEGRGIEMMFHLMNEARIGTGLQGLACGAAAYQTALAYAKERVQGVELANLRDVNARRVPIIEHPDVRRMLFTMKSKVEGMRALLTFACWLADQAKSNPDEAVQKKELGLLEILTPICKAYCSDTGFDVTVMAIQVLGGYGYCKESGVEQLARDVKVASIYEGANGIQGLDLVGRKLSKNNGELFFDLMSRIEATIEETRAHPALAELSAALESEAKRAREVTGRIAQAGMSGDVTTPALGASAYLTLLGNLVLGWLLTQQAAIAYDRISEMCLDKSARTPEARAKLVEQNADAQFYDGKLHTAAFFVKNLLPANAWLAQQIGAGYREVATARL
jgi:alkylation response protein AidB-like acyl-CoA dehydrogenase